MFKKCQLIMLFFTLLTFLFAINIAQAGTNQAAAYLESVQNPDGSWGSVHLLYILRLPRLLRPCAHLEEPGVPIREG